MTGAVRGPLIAHTARPRSRGWIAVALCGLLVLTAACGDSGAGSADAGTADGGGGQLEAGLVNEQPQASPTPGGTLRFGTAAPTTGLDPSVDTGKGGTNGNQMMAIYDALMRYDTEAQKYVPQLAKNLTHNADFTTWTLTLRPGVRFTDGTPLDAEAVVFSIKRCGRKGSSDAALVALIDSYETPDPMTVVFHLRQAWSGFPFLLIGNSGHVVSPTAAKTQGTNFTKAPVGAGPFRVEQFVPGETLKLVRNPDYWGGPPPLDGIEFTFIPQEQAKAVSLQQGQIQSSIFLDTASAVELRDAGLPGYLNLVNGAGMILNDRTGHPTHDPRVRRAIAMAIDPESVNQRVDRGDGVYGNYMFAPGSPWRSDQPLAPHDPEAARKLVEEVKQETGWDGSITIVSAKNRTKVSLAVQAMLNAVGFNATIDNVGDISNLVQRVYVDRNFDLAYWTIYINNSDPFPVLYQDFFSSSRRNVAGYENRELDALLMKLAATSGAAKHQVMNEILALWRTEMPMVFFKAGTESMFWSKDVHGLVPTENSMMLFDKAFVSSS